MTRRWVPLVATACALTACDGEDRCNGPRTGTINAYVKVHVSDAVTGKRLDEDPKNLQFTLSLACPGLPVRSGSGGWAPVFAAFDDPGPHGTTIVCKVTVAQPGYVTWTKDVSQVYDECGHPSERYELDVKLQPDS